MLDSYMHQDLLNSPLVKEQSHDRDSYQAVISNVHYQLDQMFVTAFDSAHGIWLTFHGDPNTEMKIGRSILALKANEGQLDLLSTVAVTMYNGQETAYRLYVTN